MSPFSPAFLLRLVTALAIVSGSLQYTPTAAASDNVSPVSDTLPGLFESGEPASPVPQPSLAQSPASQLPPAALRERAARLDARALDALAASAAQGVLPVSPLPLALFEDAVYTAVFDRLDQAGPSGYVLNGTLQGIPGSAAVLSVQDGVLVGQINVPGALYRILPVEGGSLIRQYDPNGFPREGDQQVPGSAAFTQNTALDAAASPDDGSRIDLLVVYTPAARSEAGGETAIRALINLAISESNTGFSNSLVSERFNLAAAAELPYDENNYCNKSSGDFWGSTLTCLTQTGDGVMDQVHALRDTYAADMVLLLVQNTGSCGLSWVMGAPPSTGFAPYAFSVVSLNCATGYYSFAHELGHAMGSLHDRASDTSGGGAYPYSYGYQQPSRAFRTIMAYNCPNGGCQRINYWSNPAVQVNGLPTGVSESSSLGANNALSLNHTASVVANFRDGPAPQAPGALSLKLTGGNQLELTWTDASADESSFSVERAPTGSGSFAPLALLPANTSRYVDSSVSCANGYDYRVQAANGNGVSAYSNSVTTGGSFCVPDQPLNLKVLTTSETQVTVAWSAANSGETGFKVERAVHGLSDWTLVGSTPSSTLTFTDTSAFCETAYDYRVRAFNLAGESASTQPASGTTSRCTAPSAPPVVTTQPICNHTLRLSWADTPNESRYVIERSSKDNGKGGWSVVGEVQGNVTSFVDVGLDAGVVYLYRVDAANAAGEAASQPVEGSPYSNAVYLPVVVR